MFQFFLVIAINILLIAIVYLFLKRRIRKSVDKETFLDDIRDEVNRMIIELNESSERNITLIEDRISRLKEMDAEASKKIRLLEQTMNVHSESRKLYSNLKPKQIIPVPVQRGDAPRETEDEILAVGHLFGSRDDTAPAQTADSTGSAESVNRNSQMTEDSAKISTEPSAEHPPSRKSSGVTVRDQYAEPEKNEAENSAQNDESSPREKVLRLHREGFPSKLIASQLHMPMGEIELIISLAENER